MNAPDPGLHDQSRYVSLTMEFRCNLACVHCMIEGTMDRLVPQGDDRFEEVMAHNRRTGQWSGLILTGSEITLRRIHVEEAALAAHFGEAWTAHAQRTWRLVPFVW